MPLSEVARADETSRAGFDRLSSNRDPDGLERGDRLDNYVLLRSHLAKQLDECEGRPEDVFDKAVVDRTDRTLAKFAATGENFRLS